MEKIKKRTDDYYWNMVYEMARLMAKRASSWYELYDKLVDEVMDFLRHEWSRELEVDEAMSIADDVIRFMRNIGFDSYSFERSDDNEE